MSRLPRDSFVDVWKKFTCIFRLFDVLARVFKAKYQVPNSWSIRMEGSAQSEQWFCVDFVAPTKPLCWRKAVCPSMRHPRCDFVVFWAGCQEVQVKNWFHTRIRARTRQAPSLSSEVPCRSASRRGYLWVCEHTTEYDCVTYSSNVGFCYHCVVNFQLGHRKPLSWQFSHCETWESPLPCFMSFSLSSRCPSAAVREVVGGRLLLSFSSLFEQEVSQVDNVLVREASISPAWNFLPSLGWGSFLAGRPSTCWSSLQECARMQSPCGNFGV